jgi:protein tyrosine phosphatase
LKNTIEDFWTLIDENNVNVIVMLCNEIENGSEKCTNYWDEKNKMTTYKIFKIKETENKNKQFIIREIKLVNLLSKKELIVKQIHFIAWPDHGVPDIKDGKIFITFDEMIKLANKYRKDNPIVVHCSAGVGKTGTFISMYCLYQEIAKQIQDNEKLIQFSIFNLVRKLKEQRLYMVQTEIQYYFIYHYVYYLLTNYNK